MTDSFKGNNKILLLEGDEGIEFDLEITQCSSSSANDGFLPYGVDATSVTMTAYNEDGTAVTSIIEQNPTIVNNIVTINLSYPTEGEGKYKLVFELGLNNGATIHAVFSRCFCEET